MHVDEPRFPPAPWTLRGDAVVAIKLVRKELVRSLIPQDAKVLCLWPRHTLAVLYLSQYLDSPAGEYREVILAPALIRRRGRVAFWISHILVDNECSQGAGRAIWALPKQMASIQWSSSRVAVDGPSLRLRATFALRRLSLRLPFIGAAMSSHDSVESWFAVRGSARTEVSRATLETDDRLLSSLGFRGEITVCVCTGMKVTIGRPARVF